ncbi:MULTISPECIES: hypothetical protein [Methylobacillus]|uniref:hypothetical protein n=1 Tax=Methylobacillus TaxID=404 RepID=UPI0002E1ABB7|nr:MULTISPECIES: hypothetical protein [Methylobacillus]MPS48043.1 hypothetical protein [Methylobacillus sp.]
MLVSEVRSSSSQASQVLQSGKLAPRLHHSQYIPAENVAEKEAAFDRISRAGNQSALVRNIDAFCDCV